MAKKFLHDADFAGKKAFGLPLPTEPDEAATKAYVDSKAADEVYIGPGTPPANQEVWFDTDDPGTAAAGGGAGGDLPEITRVTTIGTWKFISAGTGAPITPGDLRVSNMASPSPLRVNMVDSTGTNHSTTEFATIKQGDVLLLTQGSHQATLTVSSASSPTSAYRAFNGAWSGDDPGSFTMDGTLVTLALSVTAPEGSVLTAASGQPAWKPLPAPPAAGAQYLFDLDDVSMQPGTAVGKVLGTTAAGVWGPVEASGGLPPVPPPPAPVQWTVEPYVAGTRPTDGHCQLIVENNRVTGVVFADVDGGGQRHGREVAGLNPAGNNWSYQPVGGAIVTSTAEDMTYSAGSRGTYFTIMLDTPAAVVPAVGTVLNVVLPHGYEGFALVLDENENPQWSNKIAGVASTPPNWWPQFDPTYLYSAGDIVQSDGYYWVIWDDQTELAPAPTLATNFSTNWYLVDAAYAMQETVYGGEVAWRGVDLLLALFATKANTTQVVKRWKEGEDYANGTIVIYKENNFLSAWMCIQYAIASRGAPPTAPLYWRKIEPWDSTDYITPWSATTAYKPGDLCIGSDGCAYTSDIVQTGGQIPGPNNVQTWTKLSLSWLQSRVEKMFPFDTPAGKVLGTTGVGGWGPIDLPDVGWLEQTVGKTVDVNAYPVYNLYEQNQWHAEPWLDLFQTNSNPGPMVRIIRGDAAQHEVIVRLSNTRNVPSNGANFGIQIDPSGFGSGFIAPTYTTVAKTTRVTVNMVLDFVRNHPNEGVRISYHGTLNTDDPNAFCVMDLANPVSGASSALVGRVAALEARPAGGGGLDQTAADARYLRLSGGVLTGNVNLPTTPPSDSQAVRKDYMDTSISMAVGGYWKRWTGTKAQYDAIANKDQFTLYGITG